MSIGEALSDLLGSRNKKSFELLVAYYEAGGNCVDTANSYQDGESETWIGEWMEWKNLRDQMIITTKYTFDYRSSEAGKGRSAKSVENIYVLYFVHLNKTEAEVRIREALEKIAKEHATDSMTAIALAYFRSKAERVLPLIGGRKVEHLKQSIEALSIKLSPGK